MITVGLDIGTTSVKAVAADDDGHVVARARVPHEILVPFDGAFEHDIERAWRSGVLDALAQVVTGNDIAAVSVAGMVPSLGAVDRNGRAAGPGLLYGDVRGRREDRDPQQPGDTGESLAFLSWLAENCATASGFWPAQAVANHAMSGRGVISPVVAITTHPLHDFNDWDADLATGAGAPVEALPEVAPAAGEVADGLPGARAAVAGGTIDALAEQAVAGADEDGDVLVLCGTTLITWGVMSGWEDAQGLWTIPHTAAGKALVGGPSNAGGLFLDRARRWLSERADTNVMAVGPEGLPVWLPYVRGERTPLHDTGLRASLHDVTVGHNAEHLLRAAYEAAGFVVRRHVELGAAAGLQPSRVVATGGGTRSEPWMRALADCTGLPVDVAAVPEGAALGAAFDARCVAGTGETLSDARRWAATSHTVEPDRAWVDAASARYDRFVELTERMRVRDSRSQRE
jgi:xylulokinase